MTDKLKRLYLAYGSNLSREQMAYRCPGAEIVGYATIHDYELLFKGSGSGNYATIEPKEGAHVPVLVWAISDQNEASLDRYEGYPSFYYKKELKVDVRSFTSHESMGEHKAMVYIMDERRKEGLPSRYYYDVISDGYDDFGFERKPLIRAIERAISVYESRNPKLSK